MGITFNFTSSSPTQINIARMLQTMQHEQSPNAPQFDDSHLSLNESATNHLEYKDQLAMLIDEYGLKIMPKTYAIDDTNYKQVIEQLDADVAWIIKPALLNNAQGIFIFNSIEAIEQHFQQTNRFGGPHVIQQYFHPPHLLNGHKYTFRLFVLITDFNGAYLYPDGYFNVAKDAYCNEFNHLNSHLTNEHLNADDSANVYQIPTSKCPNFNKMFIEMKHITERLLSVFQHKTHMLTSKGNAFSLFGFDFIVDDSLRCWLLECNHGPCFPINPHPLTNILYQPFWQDICQHFVIPMANNQAINQESKFIALNTSLL